jgi:hypothetical protein
MCGHENGISQERYCDQVLYLVEYLDVGNVVTTTSSNSNSNSSSSTSQSAEPFVSPQPGGHGSAGPGGHFWGRCLCSPTGCFVPCKGFPNPFQEPVLANNPHLAIVRPDHIRGWQRGREIQIGQEVFVIPQEESKGLTEDEALLWKGGIFGGRAIVRQWRRCGGVRIGSDSSWHGGQILCRVRWRVQEEDAMVLLLTRDGSAGLDLSFATHIFLLERIKDPALRNQIISRAHRVGAKGAVQVQLLQVISQEPEVAIAATASQSTTIVMVE